MYNVNPDSLRIIIALKPVQASSSRGWGVDDESLVSLCSLTWWWRFSQQRFIILLLKTWPYLGPNFAEELKHSHGIETRSRDSIIIPLMIEENWAKFFTVSLRVPLEQGLPEGCKELIVISLGKGVTQSNGVSTWSTLKSQLKWYTH